MFHVKKSVAAVATGFVGFGAGLGLFAACGTDDTPPPPASHSQPAPNNNPAPAPSDSPSPEDTPSDDGGMSQPVEYDQEHGCVKYAEGWQRNADDTGYITVPTCIDSPVQASYVVQVGSNGDSCAFFPENWAGNPADPNAVYTFNYQVCPESPIQNPLW